MVSKLRLYTIALLIVFLPLSAWLVSLFGTNIISLGRDVLFALFIVLCFIDYKQFRRPSWSSILALGFFAAVMLSFFHREDSLLQLQWLRGVRFMAEPLVLFVFLEAFPLPNEKRHLSLALLLAMLCTVAGAAVEFIWPDLLRQTIGQIGHGYLGQIHLAGGARRLQSTLAGPNALGLLLMVGLLLAPKWGKLFKKIPTAFLLVLAASALLLTYSRSSYFGLFAGLLGLLIVGARQAKNYLKYGGLALVAMVVIVGALLMLRPGELTRFDSNTLRWEQYQRVWQERSEIGFWGRGAGAAGLVSQDRLDDGPNHFTENSYLDAYEAVGVLGAIFYVLFWLSLIFQSARRKQPEIFAVTIALAIAGLFINHYTGQAAIWIVLIFAGVSQAENTV